MQVTSIICSQLSPSRTKREVDEEKADVFSVRPDLTFFPWYFSTSGSFVLAGIFGSTTAERLRWISECANLF